LGLDQTPLNSNAWLSGPIEADGHFFIRSNQTRVACGFELVQAIENRKGNNEKDIMLLLANFLGVNLKVISKQYCLGKNQYRVKTNSLDSNLILSSYLQKYPLFSSKYLNYQDFVEASTLIKNKEHKGSQGKEIIYSIKNNMNTNRTLFVWDHLQDFYNLYE